MRYYLGVHKFCPLPALIGDIGWLPCYIRRQINILRFWNRLIKLDDNRLTKKVFLWDYELKINNWSSEVENILDDLSMHNILQNKTICPMKQLEEKLKFEYEKVWLNNCLQKPKLRTYVTFKDTFKTESYLFHFLSRQHRSFIAQLRLGILPLPIETGRFENIKDSLTGRFRKLKVEERKCQICNLDDIEDEKHFLCICQVYDGERYLMYEKVMEKNCDFVNLSTEMKFKYLVTHEYN